MQNTEGQQPARLTSLSCAPTPLHSGPADAPVMVNSFFMVAVRQDLHSVPLRFGKLVRLALVFDQSHLWWLPSSGPGL